MSKQNKSQSQTEETLAKQNIPSLIDIKKVIPADCLKAELSTSLYYAAKDIVLLFSLLFFTIWASKFTSLVFLPYIFLQGTLMWSVFMIGHDCGHGSFSNNDLVNDVVGVFTNSLIMVPFYQWKLSHRHHHKNTGNIDKDEIFYPIRKQHEGHKFRLLDVPTFGLGFATFGYYLAGYGYPGRDVPHFTASHPLYKEHPIGCISSLVGLGCMLGALGYCIRLYGLATVGLYYFAPLFVYATWLLVVTFLQHNDDQLPVYWYGDQEWDFVKGSLSTVDRDYGVLHHLTHHIGTHQIHHLFPKIPHYKLETATEHFRKAFPHLVRKSDERILPAMWKMSVKFAQQHVIPDNTQVHKWK
eukprot:TRINITY_DN2291_c0_g1_i1.p1 TRINITY_DN2291_c0_g1~~TRINITY_DN2291_c0_g1_i1.p1  ORF type:complete len:392 (-),score=129.62 TRINITY_DN2291_c0_g1_i1:218-1282(-)